MPDDEPRYAFAEPNNGCFFPRCAGTLPKITVTAADETGAALIKVLREEIRRRGPWPR